MLKNILIICIGNICRSPMAEALLISRLKNNNPDVNVVSAGLAALVDKPADIVAQELLQMRGIDISLHRARQVTQPMLYAADLILTMSTRQDEQIKSTLPTICGKVHRLGKWEDYDIPDPYRRPKDAFDQALVLIDQGINSWYQKLWN